MEKQGERIVWAPRGGGGEGGWIGATQILVIFPI
jgi:hypothetical protein